MTRSLLGGLGTIMDAPPGMREDGLGRGVARFTLAEAPGTPLTLRAFDPLQCERRAAVAGVQAGRA